MRYITKIHLKNIQSHVDSVIHLAPPGQITALSGPSDAGKSVVVSRALDWFFNNNWQSDYIRHGARNCSVTVYYSDGYVVTIKRPRTGSTSYVITLPNGEKLPEFEGLRNNVPVEVREITGVHPVEFGDWSFVVNIAKQTDGPFMGSSVSGPARSRIFGSLAGTDEVDLAVRMLSNQLTKDRQIQRQYVENIEKLDADLREYDYLDALRQTIQEVERLLSRVRRGAELRDKLTQLQGNLELNRINQNKTWMEIVDLEMPIDYISDIIDTQDQQINLHDNLFQRFAKLANINTAVSEQESILQSTSDVPEITLLLETLDSDTQRLEQFQKLHSGLELAQDGLEETRKVITLTKNIDEIKGIVDGTERNVVTMKKFEDILKKITENQIQLKKTEEIFESTANYQIGMDLAEKNGKDSLVLSLLLPIKDRYVIINQELTENEVTLQQTANMEKAVKLYADNEKKLPLLAALVDLKRRRGEVSKMMGDVAGMIEEYGGKVAEEKGKYVGLLKEMGVCELCGSEITEEGLERVI